MTNEQLRMQMLSGVITEGEYKAKLEELDFDRIGTMDMLSFLDSDFKDYGKSSPPKASFEDKWNDVPNTNKEILKKSTRKEPVKIMASSKGINYVITKGSDNKFYRYSYTQAENPGKPVGPFNSEEEAKKLNESLNENFVGMGMVGNIFDREKTDYELAFEHFTKGTSLNEEIEEEVEETLEEGNFDPTSYVEKSLIQVWNKGKADENMDFNSLAREIVTNLQP